MDAVGLPFHLSDVINEVFWRFKFPDPHLSKQVRHACHALAIDDERHSFTPKQLRQMQDNYDFAIALLDTGMRYDEMAKLPWSAVDIDTGSIRIYRNKVDLADTFHMTDRLKEVSEKRFRISEWWTSWLYRPRYKEGDRKFPEPRARVIDNS